MLKALRKKRSNFKKQKQKAEPNNHDNGNANDSILIILPDEITESVSAAPVIVDEGDKGAVVPKPISAAPVKDEEEEGAATGPSVNNSRRNAVIGASADTTNEHEMTHRDEEMNSALKEVDDAMEDLLMFQFQPLATKDKVLVMQGWNKVLAFSTSFSEALLVYWRLICCADASNGNNGNESDDSSKKNRHDPMDLVENNEDPIYFCLRERMADAEILIMGLLDGAIRSLCPHTQIVQREAYRPMRDNVIIERIDGEFNLECQKLQDHFALFGRLGVKPEYWVKFIHAVHWAMTTHAPYAQDDDMENLELGVTDSALGRVVASYVAIPAIQTYKELATLYKSPVVKDIQELWGSFSETGRADFGENFYRKLLSEHPQLLDYFSRTDMDSLALHLSMSLDVIIKHVHAIGSTHSFFRSALEHLGEIHRKMNVPTYSYKLVGATLLECFQPIFDQKEEATKDTDNPVSARDLRGGLAKVYSEIMSIVYYPMLLQEKKIASSQELYEQIKVELQWSDIELHDRLLQIEEEIQNTGTYIQTTEEIEVGARLAWRNSAKCVGRIAWNTLKIRDCRHVNSPSKIYDELKKHLLEATAGTNIESVMTVFQPQAPREVLGLRFWSSQLVRYAAYKNILTGEVVGDPANLALTEYLIENKLWIPPTKISRFDVLPVVLKIPGKKKPFVKELPKECIFEVDLEHPTLPELSKLGYRWTTVPAISNFKMNLGGIVYQNMPFNGWFVSTEIVRNLMERYDVGPEMAKAIGLNVDNDPMWRQTVSCELERMVLHSFQKHKFTIVDPMTVGRSFCTHVQREREEHGRECPAQWSWIGGLLGPTNPTWHLEMRDFLIKPQYDYCADGMLLHGIGSGNYDTDNCSVMTDLTEQMSVVSDFNDLELPNVLILFGSQTGNAEAAARRLKRELRLIRPKMMCLNDAKGLAFADKKNITHVLAICSTFGNGSPPDNATDFFSTTLPKFSVSGKKFAVLGLGSTIYPKFCQAGKNLHDLLVKSGLEPLATLTKADEAAGSDGTIDSWVKMMKNLILPQNIQDTIKLNPLVSSNDTQQVNELIWLNSGEVSNLNVPDHLGSKSLCLSNEELLENNETKSIRKLTFKAPSKYESGDHLSVMPVNSNAIVRRFLQCFEVELGQSLMVSSRESSDRNDSNIGEGDWLHKISNQSFDIQVLEDGAVADDADICFQTPTTLGRVLRTTLDLSLSSKDVVDLVKLLKQLIDKKMESMEKPDKKNLLNSPDVQSFHELLGNILEPKSCTQTQAVDDLVAQYPTIVDLLERFQECLTKPFFDDSPILKLADVLCVLNRLQPRFYSISSSNLVSPDEISITVGVLQVKTSRGVTVDGVCSNYLASLQGGKDKVNIAVHKSSFRLPSNPQDPIIMVGAGTGLSPMMGFLDDKNHEKKNGVTGGPIHLFFGCRTMNDFIYKETIEGLEKEGLITFHHALSRSGPKKYVQDKIKELGKEAADLLLRNDTHYYVCGDAQMANCCYEACIDVLREHAVMSRVSAANYLNKMQVQGRWQTDVWGIVNSHYEDTKKVIMNSKREAAKLWLQSFSNSVIYK